nr:hypothetical protein [Neobacillus sp. Marseille-Q6967]
MSENNPNQTDSQKKKISLQEAMKLQLENKKNKAAAGNTLSNTTQTKKLKSQQTKKVSNSRRKMGV